MPIEACDSVRVAAMSRRIRTESGMRYNAIVDDKTCTIRNATTGERVEVMAIHPRHLPDLSRLVAAVPDDMVDSLRRLLDGRAG